MCETFTFPAQVQPAGNVSTVTVTAPLRDGLLVHDCKASRAITSSG